VNNKQSAGRTHLLTRLRADAYIVISWLPFLKIDDSRYPVLQDYRARIAALPNVQAAHKRMEQNPAVVAE
jgi:glutathione S-transferase